MDRVSNEEGRRGIGIERELASWADQRVLRWFGHMKRMDDYRMGRKMLMAEVSGGRVRGWPRLGWMDGVKVVFGNRGMTVEAAQQYAEDRKEWRALVQCRWISFTLLFCLALCSFGPPSRAIVVITRKEVGCLSSWQVHDAVGRNSKKGTTTENQGAGVKYMGYRVHVGWLCVCYLTLYDYPSLVEGESHIIIIIILCRIVIIVRSEYLCRKVTFCLINMYCFRILL